MEKGRRAVRRRRPVSAVPYLLVAPAALLVGLLVAALALIFVESLRPAVGEAPSTLLQYQKIASTPSQLTYFWRSAWLSAIATAAAIVLGYPVAVYLERAKPGMRRLLLAFLVLTFFSDYVLRMFGLILVLGRNGILNQWLIWAGLVDSPVRLMFNAFGVIVGLTAACLPFTILSITGVLGRIDKSQIAAARLLGAPAWRAFWSITLPLSVPGMVSGGIITFLLCLNSFITPALLGGGFIEMVANLIYEQGINLFNLPLAAAASFLLLAAAMILIGITNSLFDRFGRRFGVVPR